MTDPNHDPSWEVAREAMLAKHPDLIRRSVEQKRERVTVR
jgi:hypothetical protein